jgi:hypothetical protein
MQLLPVPAEKGAGQAMMCQAELRPILHPGCFLVHPCPVPWIVRSLHPSREGGPAGAASPGPAHHLPLNSLALKKPFQ